MRNNKILLKLALVAFTLGSCNKYLDVNTDPNRPTDANITPELIFTQAEAAVAFRTTSNTYTLFLNHWVGYSAQNGTFAPQQNEITYNIDQSFANAIFVWWNEVLFDLHQAKVKSLETGNNGIAAASMILTADLTQQLVDLYGNIPYSQAFNVNAYPTPDYDNAKDIYNDLQGVLDSAILLLGTEAPSSFGASDIIAGGNQTLWIKFANTLKLRLLIRQSEVSGFDPSSEISKITANGGVLMAGESMSVNPGYVNDVGKQNPFYANFGWSPTGVVNTSSDNANNFIINALGNDGDPRIERFFYPVGFDGANGFLGAVYGDDISNIPPASGLSYFGPGVVGNINSANAGDGTGAAASQWIMPSYESMFLYAEAVERGWFPGTAQTAYEDAVRESFIWLGVPDAVNSANTYMANNADADYTQAGPTLAEKVNFINYQKYLANTMIDPVESYSDIRRLPNMMPSDDYISKASGNSHTTLPLRLPYPSSEATTNGTNLAKQGTIDIYSSKLFWEP